MFEWIYTLDGWLSLATLIILEVILGVDNIIFLSLLVSKLPKNMQGKGRFFGLLLAMLSRIALLFFIYELSRLTTTLFSIGGNDISTKDLVMIGGGVFLIYKGIVELKECFSTHTEHKEVKGGSFLLVIFQIAVIDIVFSLDSVISAVALSKHLPIMIIAVMVAVFVMLFAAKAIGDFIEKYVGLKILALAFLIFVGVYLVADGFEIHLDKNYLYFALGFCLVVEFLQIYQSKKVKAD